MRLKRPRVTRGLKWAAATVTKYDWGYRLVLPIPPSGNAAYRVVGKRVISSPEWLDYQAAIQLFAKIKRIYVLAPPLEIALTIRWYREAKAGDLTNREKTIEDALQGVCYANDRQVQQKQSQRYDDFVGPPRVEVEVLALASPDAQRSAGP